VVDHVILLFGWVCLSAFDGFDPTIDVFNSRRVWRSIGDGESCDPYGGHGCWWSPSPSSCVHVECLIARHGSFGADSYGSTGIASEVFGR